MERKDQLVLAEHDNQHLTCSTLRTLSAAALLPGDIYVLVIGYQCRSVVEELRCLEGIAHILVVDDIRFQNRLAEDLSAYITTLKQSFAYILAPATTFGKNVLPRVAALFDVAQISDVVQIVSPNTFIRPIYAGDVLATVESLDPIRVLTIRPTAFDSIKKGSNSCSVESLAFHQQKSISTFIELKSQASGTVNLESAKIVLAGGRGIGSREGFTLLQSMAERLGAAVGASRAAVDAGFITNDYQIGQTGKIVAPDLYIAVGISGAVQHVAGIKDSKRIVAINTDPEAPIFDVADYGLVGDWRTVLPTFTEELAIQKGDR